MTCTNIIRVINNNIIINYLKCTCHVYVENFNKVNE